MKNHQNTENARETLNDLIPRRVRLFDGLTVHDKRFQ